MNNPIQFKKRGYDPFLDFLKGFSILSVVLTHNLPLEAKEYSFFYVWGLQAVPIFLLIQVFHAYKKGSIEHIHYNVMKVLKRIILPFVIVQLLFLSVYFLRGELDKNKIFCLIQWGGFGPGAYYVWIYLQFWILLPMVSVIGCKSNICKIGGGKLLVIAFIISWVAEIICCKCNIPPYIYRLLCVRYLFLIYWGFVWAREGIEYNNYILIAGLLSLSSIVYFHYINPDLTPFFYNAWEICHWPCYIFTSTLLIYMLKFIYDRLNNHVIILFKQMGKWSYEIYLLQMLVFVFYPDIHKCYFGNFSQIVSTIYFVLITTILSIVPILIYKRFVDAIGNEP